MPLVRFIPSNLLQLAGLVLVQSHQQGSVAPVAHLAPAEVFDLGNKFGIRTVALPAKGGEGLPFSLLTLRGDHPRGRTGGLGAGLTTIIDRNAQAGVSQPQGNGAADDS